MAKKEIQVLDGQTLFDIAVQTAGSVVAAMTVAEINDVSVTDDIDISVPVKTTDILNKSIEGYYTNNSIKPATGITDKGQIFEDIFKD